MFSVCVPIYNEAENVGRIVRDVMDSELWKKSKKKELLLCVNGSTDESARIAGHLARAYPDVHAIVLPEKGKNGAWMDLVRKASPLSKTFFFLDADALVLPRTFSQLQHALERDPRLVIAGANPIPLKVKEWNAFHKRFTQHALDMLRDKGLRFFNGRCYAIRADEARGVQMPLDQRIHEDTFLELYFHNRVRVVREASVLYKLPSWKDHVLMRARSKVSMHALRESYPELFERFQRLSGVRRLRMQKIVGFLSSNRLLPGLLLNQVLEHLASRRAKRLLASKQDAWGKSTSTKKWRKVH